MRRSWARGPGRVTTGLLSAEVYLKDNRLLPRGFDKRVAPEDVAVRGQRSTIRTLGAAKIACATSSTSPGRRSVHDRSPTLVSDHRIPVGGQPPRHDAAEPRRFVTYYEAMASSSAVMLSRATGEKAE